MKNFKTGVPVFQTCVILSRNLMPDSFYLLIFKLSPLDGEKAEE